MIAFSIGLALGSSKHSHDPSAIGVKASCDRTRPDKLDLLVRQILEPPPSFVDRNTHGSAMLLEVLGRKICQVADFADGRGRLVEELP